MLVIVTLVIAAGIFSYFVANLALFASGRGTAEKPNRVVLTSIGYMLVLCASGAWLALLLIGKSTDAHITFETQILITSISVLMCFGSLIVDLFVAKGNVATKRNAIPIAIGALNTAVIWIATFYLSLD